MAKKDSNRLSTELMTLQPASNVTILPPDSGVVGTFLEQTANMFKARGMRMSGLLRRIDEAGQRTESLLRTAAERMEAAEASLQEQFNKEGLVQSNDPESDNDV